MHQRDQMMAGLLRAGDPTERNYDVAQMLVKYRNGTAHASMSDHHRLFYSQQPYVIIAAVDDQGFPWPALIGGSPGFIHSPDAHVLRIERMPPKDDPVRLALSKDAVVGILGIDMQSLKHYHITGKIFQTTPGGMAVSVTLASTARAPHMSSYTCGRGEHANGGSSATTEYSEELDESAIALISKADSFFAARYVDAATRLVHVSFRKEHVGFVSVNGNMLENSGFDDASRAGGIGNISLDSRAGFLFVDFHSGHTLQIVGRLLKGDQDARINTKSGRWTLAVERVVRRGAALAGT